MTDEKYEMLAWTPDKVAAFWDFESRFPENYFTYKLGAEVVGHFRELLSGADRILDLGCGAGFLIDHLLGAGLRAAGADVSSDSLEQVVRTYEGRAGFLGAYRVEELLERGERWPAIMVVEVFEHLYDEDLAQLVESLHRLVEPGGAIVVTTPNDEDLSKSLILCPETGKVFHRWQHVRSWSESTLAAYMRAQDFEVVAVEAVRFKASPIDRLRDRLRRLAGTSKASDFPNLTGVFRSRRG